MSRLRLTEKSAFGDFDRFTESAHGEVYQPPVTFLRSVEEIHQQSWRERSLSEKCQGQDGRNVRVLRGPLRSCQPRFNTTALADSRADGIKTDAFAGVYHGEFPGHCENCTLHANT